MSVKQAQSDIDSAEFSEWIAFHKLKPFTVDINTNVLAVIASMIGNSLRKKGTKPLRAEDFLPEAKTIKREDPRVMEAKIKSIFRIKS